MCILRSSSCPITRAPPLSSSLSLKPSPVHFQRSPFSALRFSRFYFSHSFFPSFSTSPSLSSPSSSLSFPPSGYSQILSKFRSMSISPPLSSSPPSSSISSSSSPYASVSVLSLTLSVILGVPPLTKFDWRGNKPPPISPQYSPSSFLRSYYDQGSNNYGPPEYDPNYRRNNFIIWGLLGINVFVFLMWQSARSNKEMENFMFNHFTVSLRNLSEGRIYTLLTSAFSQSDPLHLLFNSMLLYMVGKKLLWMLGPKRFAIIGVGGGLSSSICHVLYSNYLFPVLHRKSVEEQLSKKYNMQVRLPSNWVNRQYHDSPALGASGAAMSFFIVSTALEPQARIVVNFLFPVRAWILAVALLGWDLYGALTVSAVNGDRTAHFGHIGGAIFGYLYYLTKLRRIRL